MQVEHSIALADAATPAAGTTLVERDAELAALRAGFRTASSGRGSILVLRGPPGIGKSELLAAGRVLAVDEGMDVVSAAGREIERDFPFGVALQLFEPKISRADPGEQGRLLSGAAQLAAPLLVPGTKAGLPEGQGFSLLHGLYWLCLNLAERRPLAILVDDAQWADPAALGFLLYLAQRIEVLPATLVLALDSVGPGADPEVISEIAAQPVATDLRLDALSPGGVCRLLRASTFPSAADSFCRACFEATKGNPLLVAALAAELSGSGVEPTAAAVPRVHDAGPESVAAWVLRRLRRIGSAAVELSWAVAVLGDGTELRLAAELAGLGLEEAAWLLDELTAADVLARADRLFFVHPIVRRALYAARSPADRGETHLRAAHLLSNEGAEEEHVADHLLRARRSRSDWAVDALCAAAGRALSRGAPEAAVRYLRRALEEPPRRDRRPQVILELGRAEATAGEPQAVARLTEARELLTDARQRAKIALDAGRALYAQGSPRQATKALRGGIDDLRDGDQKLAAKLRAAHALAAGERLEGDPAATARLLEGEAANTEAERLLLAQSAIDRALRGDRRAEVIELARRALGDGRLLEEETSDGLGYYLATSALMLAEDLQAAQQALSDAVEDARARGSVLGFATACYHRGWALLRQGRVDDAAAEAQNALAAQRFGWRLAVPGAHAVLAEALIERGELEAAEREVELATEAADGEDELSHAAYLTSRAYVCLLTGRPEEGRADSLECGRRLKAIGASNPAAAPWRSLAARATAQLGDLPEARNLVEEELELARTFGAPGAIGRSLRTLAVVVGGDEGIACLQEAVAVLEDSEAVLILAQALVDFGSALRRAGRRRMAREALRRGLDLAERCGARAVAARARHEALAAGARPRRKALSGPEALTPRERQVAGLAAQGMSNREIAEALFVTLKTVEWHLRHAFDKLGVSSRRDLGRVLGRADQRGPAGR